MASFVAPEVKDDLLPLPAAERLYLFDGALLTQEHFRAEQLYHRGAAARLGLHLHGAGTIAGLDVTYAPTTGDGIELRVAPGIALDRLGRLVEIREERCLPLAVWVAQQAETADDAARLAAALRPADATIPTDHLIADVYLGHHPCARRPEPAFASGNADTIDGVQPSRLLDAPRLALILRPAGLAPPLPASRIAAELGAAATLADVQRFKRARAWTLTQPDPDDLAQRGVGLRPGPDHVLTGGLQDGTEVLLARLIVPVALAADGAASLDATLDLDQPPFRPDQDLRPYSYSAEELAFLAASGS